MAKGSGGGAGPGGRGGSGGGSVSAKAVSAFGGRTNADGSVTLGSRSVENAIGFSVRRRSSGSVDSASIGGQRISANSVVSVQSSMRSVTLRGKELVVKRVSGQAYVSTAYSTGINKIATQLGRGVTVRWTD